MYIYDFCVQDFSKWSQKAGEVMESPGWFIGDNRPKIHAAISFYTEDRCLLYVSTLAGRRKDCRAKMEVKAIAVAQKLGGENWQIGSHKGDVAEHEKGLHWGNMHGYISFETFLKKGLVLDDQVMLRFLIYLS